MKKTSLLFLLLLLVISPFLLFDQSRSFYCLSSDKCVTVWKRLGGTCYLIPGKYYGIIQPSGNFVKTDNGNDATVYWQNDHSGTIIVRIEHDYKIINNKKNETQIMDFNLNRDEYLNHGLYTKSSKSFSDVNKDVDFISINIKEGYAFEKNGKKL